jgi:hypothetical protein
VISELRDLELDVVDFVVTSGYPSFVLDCCIEVRAGGERMS